MKLEKNIKIILTTDIINKMKECVKKAAPNESCGLLFGEIKQLKKESAISEFQIHYIGKKFNCIEADQKSPVSFLIDNFEKLNEIYQIASQKYNLRLISIFHSHPAGAHPSGVDLKNMKYLDGFKAFKNEIWTIMDGSNHELNGFIYFQNELMQVDVQIK